HISRPPKRPVFTKRNPFDSYGTNIVGPISSFTDSMTFPYPPGNVSPPRYRRGSLIVELEIDRLLHGIAEDTAESVIVQVPPEDGEYRVPWEIHAENLSEPAK